MDFLLQNPYKKELNVMPSKPHKHPKIKMPYREVWGGYTGKTGTYVKSKHGYIGISRPNNFEQYIK